MSYVFRSRVSDPELGCVFQFQKSPADRALCGVLVLLDPLDEPDAFAAALAKAREWARGFLQVAAEAEQTTGQATETESERHCVWIGRYFASADSSAEETGGSGAAAAAGSSRVEVVDVVGLDDGDGPPVPAESVLGRSVGRTAVRAAARPDTTLRSSPLKMSLLMSS